MKLKELPLSLYHSFFLRLAPVKTNTILQLPVVVSLTSIPSRLSALDIVIKSLLHQTHPPKQILLWINEGLKNKLPQRLLALEGDVFKIKYCEGTSSYRKLLPSLKLYPASIIVTCDDDMIYPENWLKYLYDAHKREPNSVISQVGRMISRDEKQEIIKYKNWSFVRREVKSDNFLPIGYGGVLYPVNTFSDEVFNEKVFMDLSPKADDLWFKAMSYLNGKQSFCTSEKALPIPLISAKYDSLGASNIDEDANRVQWNALCKHYPDLIRLG